MRCVLRCVVWCVSDGAAIIHGVVAVVSFVTVVGRSSVVMALSVSVGWQIVRRTLVGGVGVAFVVLGVACGDACVRIPVVGEGVGVEVVGRSSVGSRSCRLYVLVGSAWW